MPVVVGGGEGVVVAAVVVEVCGAVVTGVVIPVVVVVCGFVVTGVIIIVGMPVEVGDVVEEAAGFLIFPSRYPIAPRTSAAIRIRLLQAIQLFPSNLSSSVV